MTVVTVKAGRTLAVEVNGITQILVAGETVSVPTFEVSYLRANGNIV